MNEIRSWFHDALTASVALLGDRALATFDILRSLPVEMARSNIAQGLEFAASRGRELWPHQLEATNAIREHLLGAANDPTALVVMPTASGKTEIILRAVEASGLDVDDVRLAIPTIVLVPTRQLVSQTLRAFRTRFPSLHVAGLRDGSMAPASVTVMTYDLFVDMLADGRLAPGDVRAIAMDEAHRGLSDLRQDLIRAFLDNVVLTAYSATPAFDAVKNVHSLLGAVNEVIRISDERMRAEGIISPVVDYVLRVGISGRLPQDAEERSNIVRTACENAVIEFLMGHVEDLTGIPLREKAYLGYANGIDRAHDLAGVLSAHGMQAAAVSGRDGLETIEARLEDLSAGRLDALVNDQVLMEGTDIPEARGVLAFNWTSSLVKHLQRCGRARRIDPRYPSDDPRQVTSIIETLVEINGKVVPRQRIYADAIGDLSVVRLMEGPPQRVEDLAAQVTTGRRARSYEQTDDSLVGWVSTSGDLDSVHYFLSNRDLQPCPADFISWHVLTVNLLASSSNRGLTAAHAKLEDDLRWDRATEIEGVPVRAGVYAMPNGQKSLCIHKDDVGPFRAIVGDAGGLPTWCEGWLPLYVVAERLGMTRGNPRLREAWDAILAKEKDFPGAPDGGAGIRVMRYCSHRIGYLHESLVDDLSRVLGMKEALGFSRGGDDKVPYTTLCRRHGVAVHNNAFKGLWHRLVAAFEKDGEVVVEGRTIGFGMFRTRTNKPAFFIDEADVAWFVETTGVMNRRVDAPRPTGWINKAEARALLAGEADVPGLDAFWMRLAAEKGMGREERAKWGGRQFASERWTRPEFCIPIEKLEDLRAIFLVPKDQLTEDWLTLHRVSSDQDKGNGFRLHLKKAWRELEQRQAAGLGTDGYRFEHRDRVTSRFFCLYVDDVRRFLDEQWKVYSRLIDDVGWLTRTEVIERLAGGYNEEASGVAWDLLVSMAENGAVTDEGRRIAFEIKRLKKWHLHEDELPWFANLVGLPLARRKVTSDRQVAVRPDHEETTSDVAESGFSPSP